MLGESEFEILYAIKKRGLVSLRELAAISGASLGTVSQSVTLFKDEGLVNGKGITPSGLLALAPYKVDNAVIMAAGLSSRFVPLSLEKPKGLLIVKGEVLIERQIRQLQEAGIKNIILVLGYKKESFFYLEEKYGVKIIINSEFNVKNNTETLYLVRQFLGNSYICSSDDYFAKNVFESYVYTTYYAAVHVTEKSNEWYMIPGLKKEIKKVVRSGAEGDVMLGHAYWNREFSRAFSDLLIEHHELGDYDQVLWEQLFADNIKRLPPMKIKTYPNDVIFEFDSLEELRKFDDKYVNNVESTIMKNICGVLSCEQKDITGFKAIKEGMTNTSFVFEVKGTKYVYRHPGDGTNAMVDRKHEKIALQLAKKAGVDPTFLYMNEDEGWKVSYYVPGIRLPDYRNFEDSKRVLKVLRKLHDQMAQVPWEFDPWEDSKRMEALVRKAGPIEMPDFEDLKSKAVAVYNLIKDDAVPKRFCHCDTYGPNWMLTKDQTILIDWEYAGNADPAMDVGGYIMDAMYSVDESRRFIREYLGSDDSPNMERHYLGYVALYSYWCVLWALYRESCGAVLRESLHNWYVMAKRYSEYLLSEEVSKK